MSFNLRESLASFLRSNPNKKFKARDMAIWLYETFPDAAAEKINNSTFLTGRDDLLQQLVAEIGARRLDILKHHPQIRTDEGVKPRKYYWTELTEEQEAGATATSDPTAALDVALKVSEAELYPKLIDYLQSELSTHGSRIDERRASNTRGGGGNKWLFPDIVGVKLLVGSFHPEVKTLVRELREPDTIISSYEVKLKLNISNVRETYYQAVSNSSWAHLGYLVAAEINGAETISELELLYSMHGIGVIRLDPLSPSESSILIPARPKHQLEWAMCDRIAKENPDFLRFLKRLRHYHQTGDLY